MKKAKLGDALAELGALAVKPEANIIKLPNISASMPQLKAAIKELQAQGYKLPDYPDSPANDTERDVKARYDRSRAAPSTRCCAKATPTAARCRSELRPQAPHKMGAWAADSKSHVSHMNEGDFYGTEKSALIAEAGDLKIELAAADGAVTVLKDKTPVKAGEIIDAAVMSVAKSF